MKTYVKPELYFESFELSQTVAACDVKVSLLDDATCYVMEDRAFGGDIKNAFNNSNCGFLLEAYCLTNSSASLGTFQS